MQVLRDVEIERMEHQELVAVSRTPAVIGEEMTLELFSGCGSIALKVQVLDSRPVVIAGSVRHRLRVLVATAGALTTRSIRESFADSPIAPEVG